jgi:predicted O-methyltransferase YrrM
MDATRAIWERFHIKKHDNLPYTPWAPVTRDDLALVFADCGFTYGAEVGVCKGEFSALLLKTVPGLKLLCIDPWFAYERLTPERAEARYAEARARLAGLNCEIVRQTSLEAVQSVAENSLDFVFIDGAHDFDNVMRDIIEWARRVKPGGIVAGHDYYHFYQSGVVQAVNAYVSAHNLVWYVTKEQETTWLWVKP